MSLVIALAGKDEIVMASDTLVVQGNKDGHYTDRFSPEFSKIRLAANPKFGIGIAGHIGAEDFIKNDKALNSSFDALVESCQSQIWQEYKKGQKCYDMEFLFCGVEETIKIRRCRFYLDNAEPACNGIEPMLTKAAIGINEHGALLYMHGYHSDVMTTDQLIFLACFCMTEAISHDERLRRPIEMAVVRRNQNVLRVSPEKVKVIEEVCKERHDAIGEILERSDQRLDCSSSLCSLEL